MWYFSRYHIRTKKKWIELELCKVKDCLRIFYRWPFLNWDCNERFFLWQETRKNTSKAFGFYSAASYQSRLDMIHKKYHSPKRETIWIEHNWTTYLVLLVSMWISSLCIHSHLYVLNRFITILIRYFISQLINVWNVTSYIVRGTWSEEMLEVYSVHNEVKEIWTHSLGN